MHLFSFCLQFGTVQPQANNTGVMPVSVPVPNVAYSAPNHGFANQGIPQGSNIVLLQPSGGGNTSATLQAAAGPSNSGM